MVGGRGALDDRNGTTCRCGTDQLFGTIIGWLPWPSRRATRRSTRRRPLRLRAPPGLWGGEIAEHEEAIEELGEKVMGSARARAAEQGVEIEGQLEPKRAADALIETAEQRDARMIFVGSFGDSPLKGVILGSTPNKLLHLSERPVLVVPARS
ncbi:MAG: universal stress protein [Solirubrobacterales bacterium]